MSNNFQDAINLIRKKANNETEKGNAFEKLSKIYFTIILLLIFVST